MGAATALTIPDAVVSAVIVKSERRSCWPARTPDPLLCYFDLSASLRRGRTVRGLREPPFSGRPFPVQRYHRG